MQQKKYSFNYLIFKQDFIKRRMLVNPATHPVGVSVSEQTLPQCDQQAVSYTHLTLPTILLV